MTEQENETTEWEGFEQFQDLSGSTHTQLLQTNLTNVTKEEETPYSISPQKSISKNRVPRRKQSDLLNDQASSVPEPSLKQSSVSCKPSEERVGPRVQPRRYERIPIIRYEQQCRYSGRVIYKNFVPRTSDNYMRILKEVDWQQSWDKKRDIRNLHGIEFNSQFESGNLNLAIELQYDLYMRVDSNTNGHRQWFYFSMKNERKCRVRLHLYRFKKIYSLFQRGMRPYARSRKAGRDWHPAAEHVSYHSERQRNEYGVKKDLKTYVLSFQYTFQHDNDEVYIAAGIPYSYTFLQKQLSQYKEQADCRENLHFEVSQLCRSMCGLEVPLITIEHRMSKLIHDGKDRRFIVINARTHSGETPSSWVLDGLLLELTQSKEAEEWLLAENICLKIAPMLNPDGVFIGNYRTGIVGDDFNRKFSSGKKEFYPEIFALKKLIGQCKREGTVELFLDLHGHSILKNSFIYGPDEGFVSRSRLKSLPYHLFHTSKYFRLASCKFKTDNENVETARVYFQAREEILTFTCESSLGLYHSQGQTFQMLAGDWQLFGQQILHSMRDAFSKNDVPILFEVKPKQKPSPKTLSLKSNLSSEIQQKLGLEDKLKKRSTKNNKKDKVYFRLPTATKHPEPTPQLLEKGNSFSFSQQIVREDEVISPKQLSYHQKQSSVPKKAGTMKVSATLVNRIIGKSKGEPQRKDSTEQENPWFCWGRSSTFDNASTLQREIDLMNKHQEQESNSQLDIEAINQNFSDDYVSMNDSDSEGEDLPEQERNYLFEYIKSNQHHALSNEDQDCDSRKNSEKEERFSHYKDPLEQKISRFREIRFKSIEQGPEGEANNKNVPLTSIKKPKLEAHKFKDNTSKSLIYKYNEIVSHNEFDDPSLIAFSQQKRLIERSQHRRAQKVPFVLFQRKEREREAP